MKTCTKCQQSKSTIEFYLKGGKPRAACKACHNAGLAKPTKEQSREWAKARRERDPDTDRKRQIKYQYGLDWDTYLAMTANGCEVCGSFDRLCVDHDHGCCPGQKTCGECVRGILCHKCNRTEGLYTAEELIALAAYMIKTTTDKETDTAEPVAV